MKKLENQYLIFIMETNGSDLISHEYFEDKTFSGIALSPENRLSEMEFHECKFLNCKFPKVIFFDCRFEKCEFHDCDLTAISIRHCVFDSVLFKESKLAGIQWADTGIPLNVIFRQCSLNYCSFIGVNLRNTEMTNCDIKDADFSETNLSRSDCRYSDFSGTRFINTNLEYTDLSYASNYSIHPDGNKLKKTVFSLPDVLSLLDTYDIIIK